MEHPTAVRTAGDDPAYAGWDGRLTMVALAYFFFGWEWVESEVSVLVGMVVALTLIAAVAGTLAADYATT